MALEVLIVNGDRYLVNTESPAVAKTNTNKHVEVQRTKHKHT